MRCRCRSWFVSFASVLSVSMQVWAFPPKAQFEGVAYLPGYSSEVEGYEILRYDFAARAWLEPIRQPPQDAIHPHQIEVDASGIYLRRDTSVVRLAHDGNAVAVLSEGQPSGFAIDGDRLFVADSGVLRSLRKDDGSLVSERPLPPFAHSFALASEEDRLVFHGERDVFAVAFDADGLLGPVVAPEGIGVRDYFPGTRPAFDGRRVLARAGSVHDARTLAYLGAVPADVDDAAWAGGVLFVAGRQGSDELIGAFDDRSLAEIGRVARPSTVLALFAHAGELFAFSWENESVSVTIYPLSDFRPPPTEEPIDPSGVVYRTRLAAVAREEVAVLLPDSYELTQGHPQEGRQLFRWSLETRTFLPSIPLREAPERMVYAPDADALYLLYPSRRITRIEHPGGDRPEEVEFAVLPYRASSATWLAPHLVVASPAELCVFDAAGTLRRVTELPRGIDSDVLAAASANARIYALESYPEGIASFELDADARPASLVLEPGPVTSTGAIVPSPDGAFVFEGSAIRDGTTLEIAAPVAREGYVVAAWRDEELVVAEGVWRELRLRALRPPFAQPSWALSLPDIEPSGLLSAGDGLLLLYHAPTSMYRQTHLAKIYPGVDLDGDGVPNDRDLYPIDPTESADRDGDGFGDNGDAFPDDPTQHADRDGDRIADPLDLFPDDAERATAITSLEVRLIVPPFGFLEGSLYARVHLFWDQGFLLCPQSLPEPPCLPGFWRPTRGRRLEIVWPDEVVAAFEDGIESDLEEALSSFRGRPIDLDLEIPRDRVRLRASVSKNGKRLRLSLKLPWVATTDDLGLETLRGTFRIRGETETLAR